MTKNPQGRRLFAKAGKNMANGSGRLESVWQVVIATISAVFLLVAGFWYLADPRQAIAELRSFFTAEIKDIRGNYLSIREHEAFITRHTNDIQRVEKENADERKELVSRREFEAWKKERDDRVRVIEATVDDTRKNSVSRNELGGHIERDKDAGESLRREVDSLRREITQMNDRLIAVNNRLLDEARTHRTDVTPSSSVK